MFSPSIFLYYSKFLLEFSILLNFIIQKRAFLCQKQLKVGTYIFMITFTFPYLDQRVFTTTIVVLICFSPNRHYSYATNTKSFPVPFREWNSESPFLLHRYFATLTLRSIVVVQLLAQSIIIISVLLKKKFRETARNFGFTKKVFWYVMSVSFLF